MEAEEVEGGHRLAGCVEVEGNKNSALPLLAACLLTDEPCVLNNVPRIMDVQVMADLLTGLGADVNGVGTTTLRVSSTRVVSEEPDRKLVGSELGDSALIPVLDEFLAHRFNRLESIAAGIAPEPRGDTEKLNEIFRRCLREAWL